IHTLQPGEKVLAQARSHWIIYSKAILCAVVAPIALFVAGAGGDAWRLPSNFATGTLVILSILLAIPPLWRQVTTEIACTNRRMIVKRGFISRHTVEMSLSNIESTYVDQSILGRLLNFGTIHCRGSGGGLEHLHKIASPIKFRSAISTQ